jgi:hypothetical protein
MHQYRLAEVTVATGARASQARSIVTSMPLSIRVFTKRKKASAYPSYKSDLSMCGGNTLAGFSVDFDFGMPSTKEKISDSLHLHLGAIFFYHSSIMPKKFFCFGALTI